jgi:hypothetical protein
MRFVLGNRLLDRAGGTEVHLLTLGEQLQRLGHDVCLYSPVLGPFTDHVHARGVEAVGKLRELPEERDVVFSQDALVAFDLAERYPAAFHVFRVCGDVFDFQLPPQVPGLIDLVVALSDRYARLASACAVATPLLRLRLPVDIDRLTAVGRIRERPGRAVILGNYGARDDDIRAAWGPRGVEVTCVGGRRQRYDVADAVADADIVVGKGRAALDGMACGRAVYVLDVLGGDGWVTPAAYPGLEADNFAGQATDRVVGVADLVADLAGYDAGMGVANRDLVAQHHNGLDHAIELVDAIAGRRTIARQHSPLREIGRLTSLQWSWERIARGLQEDRVEWVARIQQADGVRVAAEAMADDLRERSAAEIAELQRELTELACASDHERAAAASREMLLAQAVEAAREEAAGAAALRADLDQMRATRAWRLAVGYWRLRGRLR